MSEEIEIFDWEKAVEKLSQRLSGRCFHPQIEALLRRARVRRILVSCSGGADSVLMLCLLRGQAAVMGLDLSVAHYNHRWRADASSQDAEFVESMARAIGCPYYYGERPPKEAAFTETTARALRLDFLRQTAQETNCGWIAIGHQLDDILETQLQRIGRGSGSDGLAAPRPISLFTNRPSHIRPLLHLRSGEIRMLLSSCAVPWRKDSSNEDTLIPRNGLRHRIIPEFSEVLGRDAALGASRSRSLLEEDAHALDLWARERMPTAYSKSDFLERGLLRAAPRALSRRALTEWLSLNDLLHSMSAAAMDLLIDAVYSDRATHRISAGQSFLVLTKDYVRIEPLIPLGVDDIIEPCSLIAGNSVILPAGGVIQTTFITLSEKKRSSILRGEVKQSEEAYIVCAPDEALTVRGWMPGDRFRPIGAPGTKKLKDWFIDRHIPQKERKLIPLVLSAAKEVTWVPGFPPAESAKIGPNSKMALRLTYQNRNPL